MTDTVLARRFVNTPTLKEIWEQEHGATETEVADEEVDKLSDEYDRSSGMEGYYQLCFQHLQSPHRAVFVDGNEGFFEEIGKGISYVIDQVKRFFKWVFGFFTSKKRAAEKTSDTLRQSIHKHGVKPWEIEYPKDYWVLWGKPGNPGNDLGWMSKSIDGYVESMKKCKEYVEAVKKYCTDVSQISINNEGSIEKGKSTFENVAEALDKQIRSIFKPGPWIAGQTLEIKEGKVLMRPDPKIKATKTLKFKTSEKVVLDILDKVDVAVDDFGKLVVDICTAETKATALLEHVGQFANAAKEAGKQKQMNALIEKAKKSINNMMAALKSLQGMYFRLMTVSMNILRATVKSPGDQEKPTKE